MSADSGMSAESAGRRPTDIESLLRPPEQALWRNSLDQMAHGLRARALEILESFVAGLQSYPAEERRRWVRAWCRARLDEDADLLLPFWYVGGISSAPHAC